MQGGRIRDASKGTVTGHGDRLGTRGGGGVRDDREWGAEPSPLPPSRLRA